MSTKHTLEHVNNRRDLNINVELFLCNSRRHCCITRHNVAARHDEYISTKTVSRGSNYNNKAREIVSAALQSRSIGSKEIESTS